MSTARHQRRRGTLPRAGVVDGHEAPDERGEVQAIWRVVLRNLGGLRCVSVGVAPVNFVALEKTGRKPARLNRGLFFLPMDSKQNRHKN